MTGALAAPGTRAGQALLDLIEPHLGGIGAGAEAHDRNGTFPVATFEKLGAGGVLGATVPTELGGLGLDRLYDVAVALKTVAAVDASTALALHAQFSRGLTYSYEWRHGTPEARALAERLLKLMAAGEPVCGGVKDHHSTVTTLTPDGRGDWRLTGRTTLVTMAQVAKHIIVLAQIPGRDGAPTRLAAPLLSPETPGVAVLDNWDGLGMRASGTVDIVFDDCPVPASDVLIRGVLGARSDAALAGQTVSSAAMLGIYTGVAQAARDLTVATLAGRPDPPSPAVRTLVAEIDARLYALGATAGTALATADAVGDDLTAEPGERGRRMMRPFQFAKLMINRLAPAIVDDCAVLVGGAAYTAAHPLSRFARDVRAGAFMQPYTYGDAVDVLSSQALGLHHDNDYLSVRAARASDTTNRGR